MAMNKAQTSLLAKVVIGLFGVILVIGLAGPSVSALLASLGGNGSSNDTSGGQGTLDAIAAEYQPTITSWEGILQSDPTSTTPMIALGNTYFDWALRLQQTQGVTPGTDVPYWRISAQYYQQAVAGGVDDPGVAVDGAIATFYGGDTATAVSMAVEVMRAEPDFAPAWFNGAIFLTDAGRTGEALAAFQRYVELDPQGTTGNLDYANEQITGFEQQGVVAIDPLQSTEATTAP